MKKLVVACATALVALVALTPHAGAHTTPATTDGTHAHTGPPDGGARAGGAPLDLAPPDETEREFLITAARVALAEILQGVVATQRGQSDEVRHFGSEMIDDHFRQVLQQLPIHLVYGVPIPATTPEQDAQLLALLNVPADDFDEVYLTAQVAAHEQALALFRAAAADARNTFVQSFSAAQVPLLEMHLDHAVALLADVAGPTS